MTLHLSNCKIKSKYLTGYISSKEALRKRRYVLTISGNNDFKDVFYSETLTKKKNGEWQTGETHYYFEDDETMYNTYEELLKTKYKLI